MGTLVAWSHGTLWLGFLLQMALLVRLARGRLASVLPIFTGLLVFYTLRSFLLFGLVGHIPRETYGALYNGLSLTDFMLQAIVAGELLLRIVPRGQRLVAGATALLIATGAAVSVAALLPSRSPAPADRATIFTGLLFVTLLGIATRFHPRGWVRSVVTGLAVAGLSGALAECGKSVAASHRNSLEYVAWSYGNAAVYLSMLVYWIFVASRLGKRPESAHTAPIQLVRGTI